MKKILLTNKSFLSLFLIWLVFGFIYMLNIEKGDLVLWFNSHRTPFRNVFFILATKLAEWPFILFCLAILLYKKYGDAFILLITWAITGVIAQTLKRFFSEPRPAGYFKDITLNFLDITNIHYAHSFPSGHTTTAFAIFFIFSLFTKNKYLKVLFFLLALSTGFSRVYLLQHFFIDVYFGSILGIIIASLIFVTINKSNIFGFQKWKDKRILNQQFYKK